MYHHASTLSLRVFQLNQLSFILSNTEAPSSARRRIITDDEEYVRMIVRDHQLISCLLGLCWRAAHSKPHCYEHYHFNSWSHVCTYRKTLKENSHLWPVDFLNVFAGKNTVHKHENSTKRQSWVLRKTNRTSSATPEALTNSYFRFPSSRIHSKYKNNL